MYRPCRAGSGSRNAAFTKIANVSAGEAFSAPAMAGVVDHTREEAVGESGRQAMGPVGKNLWNAVVLFCVR